MDESTSTEIEGWKVDTEALERILAVMIREVDDREAEGKPERARALARRILGAIFKDPAMQDLTWLTETMTRS